LSVFNTLRWEVIVCFCYLCSIRWDERWLFVLLSVFNTLRWEVIVCFCCLCSIRWDERWLFVFVICVQYVEMGGDCLFCWYWCNCWPSTFDISYHNIRSCCKYMILLIFSGYINLLVRFCFYNETAFSNSIIFFGKLSFIF
jgi:hypothetical protein